MSQRIEKLLEKALLFDGKMKYGLYKHELEEHINYWSHFMDKDKDVFVFVVTENRNHVAMLLLTNEKELFINEEARSKLQKLWPIDAYVYNLQKLIPLMAQQIEKGIISVNGVKYNE
jgi:hypothetical protein